MGINPDAVGSTSEATESSWTSKDSLLYAVGIGAGTDDLAFTTENSMNIDQRAYPTQAVVLGDASGAFANIGSFNPAMLVHGEQAITLHRELPVEGTVVTTGEVTAVWDKGKGAVVEVTSRSVSPDGEPLFDKVMSVFIRGEGGFGGERGPSGPRNAPPEGTSPDVEVTLPTREDQALIYRLSGDRNPLHSDPSFAELAGFDRPILHGLCTYGITGRALLGGLCDGDPARFRSMEGRFSSPVFPGESLTVRMWSDGDGAALFSTHGGDGRVVLDAGRVTFDPA
ncbi:MAG: MaoC/PaaZ C-terminal domain-containing protein [Microthrixaceae bacterium]